MSSRDERVFIKPGVMPDGTPMKARKPNGGWLSDAGEEVSLDSHWRRRLADGDVVVAEPARPAKAPKTSTP